MSRKDDDLRRSGRKQLAAKQDFICPWCELPLPEDLTDTDMDHIIPRSRGGPGDIWNRQVLHKDCNRGPGGKGNKLTAEAEALAALHGVVLHEPLPRSWPGSTSSDQLHKVSPERAARLAAQPTGQPSKPKVEVSIRKVYEVECHTCHCIIDAPDSYAAAVEAKRDHVATHRPLPVGVSGIRRNVSA